MVTVFLPPWCDVETDACSRLLAGSLISPMVLLLCSLKIPRANGCCYLREEYVACLQSTSSVNTWANPSILLLSDNEEKKLDQLIMDYYNSQVYR